MTPTAPGRGGIDRRRFIQAGAAGTAAAAVWTAPSILSLDRAFAVTSPCAGPGYTVNWPAGYAQGAPGTTSLGSLANYNPAGVPPGWLVVGQGVAGLDLRFLLTNAPQAATRLVFFPDATYQGFNTGVQTGTRSGYTGFYSMLMHNAAALQGAKLVITFSKKIFGLDLPIIELTKGGRTTGVRYTDQVVVTGYNNYGGVGGTQAAVPISAPTVGSLVTTSIASGTTLTATGTAQPTNDGRTSVLARFTGPLDAVEIIYRQGDATVNSANGDWMFIGLGDMVWTCHA